MSCSKEGCDHLTSRMLVYSLAACNSSSSERGAISSLILYTCLSSSCVLKHFSYLSWLVVDHFWTLSCSQFCEKPHPKAGGNLKLQKWKHKVVNNLLCGSSNRAVSCCGRQGRIPLSSLGWTSGHLPRTSSRSTHPPAERQMHRLPRAAAAFLPSHPLNLLPPPALRNLNSYHFFSRYIKSVWQFVDVETDLSWWSVPRHVDPPYLICDWEDSLEEKQSWCGKEDEGGECEKRFLSSTGKRPPAPTHRSAGEMILENNLLKGDCSYSYRMTKVSLYDLKIIFILSNSDSEGLALGRSPTVNTSRAGFSVRNKIEENWEWTSWHRIFYYSTSPIDEYYKHSRHSPSFRYIFLFIPLDILYGEKIVKMSRSDLKRVQKRKKKPYFLSLKIGHLIVHGMLYKLFSKSYDQAFHLLSLLGQTFLTWSLFGLCIF